VDSDGTEHEHCESARGSLDVGSGMPGTKEGNESFALQFLAPNGSNSFATSGVSLECIDFFRLFRLLGGGRP
jgi:hypothetical protein